MQCARLTVTAHNKTKTTALKHESRTYKLKVGRLIHRAEMGVNNKIPIVYPLMEGRGRGPDTTGPILAFAMRSTGAPPSLSRRRATATCANGMTWQ